MNHNMNCSLCQELLDDFRRGLLSNEDAQGVTAHLETCADCRRELEVAESLGAMLRDSTSALMELPPTSSIALESVRARVAQAIDQEVPAKVLDVPMRRKSTSRPALKWTYAAAAVLALGFMGYGILNSRLNEKLAEPRAGGAKREIAASAQQKDLYSSDKMEPPRPAPAASADQSRDKYGSPLSAETEVANVKATAEKRQEASTDSASGSVANEADGVSKLSKAVATADAQELLVEEKKQIASAAPEAEIGGSFPDGGRYYWDENFSREEAGIPARKKDVVRRAGQDITMDAPPADSSALPDEAASFALKAEGALGRASQAPPASAAAPALPSIQASPNGPIPAATPIPAQPPAKRAADSDDNVSLNTRIDLREAPGLASLGVSQSKPSGLVGGSNLETKSQVIVEEQATANDLTFTSEEGGSSVAISLESGHVASRAKFSVPGDAAPASSMRKSSVDESGNIRFYSDRAETRARSLSKSAGSTESRQLAYENAENLRQSQKFNEAIAAYTAIVSEQRDSAVATQAQLRIAEIYQDNVRSEEKARETLESLLVPPFRKYLDELTIQAVEARLQKLRQ